VCFVVVLSGNAVSSGLHHFDSLKSVHPSKKVGLKEIKLTGGTRWLKCSRVCIRECETHLKKSGGISKKRGCRRKRGDNTKSDMLWSADLASFSWTCAKEVGKGTNKLYFTNGSPLGVHATQQPAT
jgi:hypothetical protein